MNIKYILISYNQTEEKENVSPSKQGGKFLLEVAIF